MHNLYSPQQEEAPINGAWDSAEKATKYPIKLMKEREKDTESCDPSWKMYHVHSP